TSADVQSGYWNSDVNMYVYGTDSSKFVPDADPSKTTNPTVTDSDGDGLSDGAEDPNHDGAVGGKPETDPSNPDSDGDGLKDGAELAAGTDARDADTDDDGLWDGPSVGNYTGEMAFGTLANDADFDNDGLTDGQEVGLTGAKVKMGEATYHGYTVWYTGSAFLPDADDKTTTEPKVADTDDDGLLDGPTLTFNGKRYVGEAQYATDPTGAVGDKDADGIPDYIEVGLYYISGADKNILLDGETGDVRISATAQPGGSWGAWADRGALKTRPDRNDTDGDTVHDKTELDWGMDPTVDDRGQDSDKDGLQNLVEYWYNFNYSAAHNGGNPIVIFNAGLPDSDIDGIPDKVEYDFALANAGADPLDPIAGAGDYDNDGLTNYEEMYVYLTNWTWDDYDNDTLLDGTEIAMGTDPKDPDTDKDMIEDGAEPMVVYRTGAKTVDEFNTSWVQVDANWADWTFALNNYTHAGYYKYPASTGKISKTNIGSTPEGYNITISDGTLTIWVNETTNYETGAYLLTWYDFAFTASAIANYWTAPIQAYATTSREVWGGLPHAINHSSSAPSP
ncbi:MAG: hypothetical protein V1934_03785, partial [Methanobacteriota archaeon]